MIQPGKLRLLNAAEIPACISQAWEAHNSFVTMSSFAAKSIGVRFLKDIPGDIVTLGFMRQILERQGMPEHLEWLIDHGVLQEDDRGLWNVAVDEYASRAF
jgi:hypothetical protein